jgi:RimJ/RimL family protein N-acetyltransferase
MSKAIDLRRGTSDDVPFIMRTERIDGYEAVVGRWDEARHRSAFADPRYAYFIAEAADRPIGFAMLRDWASHDRVTLVQRVAVTEPGKGGGTAMMRAVVDAAFTDTDVHRLWIGCFPENLRARRTYEAVGFVAEGIARGSAFFHGEHRDELILSQLRPDWEALRVAQSA